MWSRQNLEIGNEHEAKTTLAASAARISFAEILVIGISNAFHA